MRFAEFQQQITNPANGLQIIDATDRGWWNQVYQGFLFGYISALAPAIVVGKFRSEKLYGPQDYGNAVSYYPGSSGIGTERTIWVSCKVRYEPKTRNHGGRLGAWRDIPDEAGIEAAIAELTRYYEGRVAA